MNIVERYIGNGHQIDQIIQDQIADEIIRDEIYQHIPNDPPSELHSLIQALFREEMDFRKALWDGRKEDSENYYENIYLCAFFLFKIGDLSDLYLLWEAKYLNMDVGSSLDGNYFLGAGPQQTRDFLEGKTDGTSKDLYSYVIWYIENPEDHDGWEEYMLNYFDRVSKG